MGDIKQDVKDFQLEIAAIMLASLDKYKEENPPEKIEADTIAKLEESRDEIIAKLLGFDNRWQRGYELDHCNGRSGNSAAGDYLVEHQRAAVQEWLSKVDLSTVAFTPKMEETMLERFNKAYSDHLNMLIKNHANNLAKEAFNKMLAEDPLGDIEKIDSLLEP